MTKQIRAALALPFMVTVVIPLILLVVTGQVNIGWSFPVPINLIPVVVGVLLIGYGLSLMIRTIRLFSSVGRGTLAPWSPPSRLVVVGVYRYVRNPMISGVMVVLLGESVLLGSWTLFVWFVLASALNLLYIPLSEEPGLEQRFGADYQLYRQHVPRWIPRRQAWIPPWDQPPMNADRT